MPRLPRITVISAFAGEPQRPAAEAMLARQQGVEVSSIWIEGLGMDEAMGEVHRHSVAATKHADWVVKLDGDMVPRSPSSLARLVHAATRAGTPRLTTPVADFFTAGQISGVHILRPSAVPAQREVVAHRPDHWISAIPGTVWRRVWWPQVLHAPNPDNAQALRFGLQRGLKAVEDGIHSSHWGTISEVAHAARVHPHPARWAALLGAFVGVGLDPAVPAPDRRWVDRSSDRFQALLEQAAREDLAEKLEAFASRRAVYDHHRVRYGMGLPTAKAIARLVTREVRPWLWPPPKRM